MRLDEMRLISVADKKAIGCWAAKHIIMRINEFNPGVDRPFVLGLPTGSTPLETYRELIEAYRQGSVSFENVVTFNMDEYLGLAPGNPKSYSYFMYQNFFNHINIPKRNINLFDGTIDYKTAASHCEDYELRIKSAGGIRLFMGGVGEDGHIAFNEPGSSLSSLSRVKTLTRETIFANSRFFDSEDEVPTHALTVGVKTILDAREVLILASGENKARAIAMAVEGSVNHMWTVTALQLHPSAIIVCDEDASLDMKLRTLKYFERSEKALGNLESGI